MTILLVSPGQQPKKTTIDDTLAAMQRTVGGPIQAIYPFEEPVPSSATRRESSCTFPSTGPSAPRTSARSAASLPGTSSSAPRRRTASTSRVSRTTSWSGTPKSSAPRSCSSPVPASASSSCRCPALLSSVLMGQCFQKIRQCLPLTIRKLPELH